MNLKPEVKEQISTNRNLRLELCKTENLNLSEAMLLRKLRDDHVTLLRYPILLLIATGLGYNDINDIVQN